MDRDPDPFSLLGRPLPPAFVSRVVRLEPEQALPIVEDEWRDALIVVEEGAIEVECSAGGRRTFACGAVLWFEGLDLRTVHNPGGATAVFAAVSRRGDDTP